MKHGLCGQLKRHLQMNYRERIEHHAGFDWNFFVGIDNITSKDELLKAPVIMRFRN